MGHWDGVWIGFIPSSQECELDNQNVIHHIVTEHFRATYNSVQLQRNAYELDFAYTYINNGWSAYIVYEITQCQSNSKERALKVNAQPCLHSCYLTEGENKRQRNTDPLRSEQLGTLILAMCAS